MGASTSGHWSYHNPVKVDFGVGLFDRLGEELLGKRWAACTYPEDWCGALIDRLAATAGEPVLRVTDIAPNPDAAELTQQCGLFAGPDAPELIVAIGGGSVIDSAKVFAASGGDFAVVRAILEKQDVASRPPAIPLIAVPTTAGTGSEVTCWATVWDREADKKYSLASPDLYPVRAVVDPELMVAMSRELTVSTGLDALSHALESLWNHHANPVSAGYAVKAARESIDVLPQLVERLDNIELRRRMAFAATCAGLAFSNTRTALAHNLSYPVTLGYGVPHGIACSFTLPAVLLSVEGADDFRVEALHEIFGRDLKAGAHALKEMLQSLDVPTDAASYGIEALEWGRIVDDAFVGERGKNFMGSFDAFDRASREIGLVHA